MQLYHTESPVWPDGGPGVRDGGQLIFSMQVTKGTTLKIENVWGCVPYPLKFLGTPTESLLRQATVWKTN